MVWFRIEYVPGTADIGTESRADDDAETTGGNKASAEIDGLHQFM